MNHLSLWVHDRPEIPKTGIAVTVRRLLTVSQRGNHGLNWTVTAEIEGIKIFLFLYLSASLATYSHSRIHVHKHIQWWKTFVRIFIWEAYAYLVRLQNWNGITPYILYLLMHLTDLEHLCINAHIGLSSVCLQCLPQVPKYSVIMDLSESISDKNWQWQFNYLFYLFFLCFLFPCCNEHPYILFFEC